MKATRPKTRSTPTSLEHEQRVNAALRMIVCGCHDGEIKRTMAETYDCSTRSVERHIKAARQLLQERSGRSRVEHQAMSLARYESVVRRYGIESDHGGVSVRDYLFACKRIDELLGLEEPRRTELSGPGGGPIKSDHSHDLSRAVLTDPEAHKLAADLAERIVALEQDDETNGLALSA